MLYKNNKFNISAPSWIGNFDLTDKSYFVSDIQDCFKYITKIPVKFAVKPQI